jgi:hypothetical protein
MCLLTPFVYIQLPPGGAYRGFGYSEMLFGLNPISRVLLTNWASMKWNSVASMPSRLVILHAYGAK